MQEIQNKERLLFARELLRKNAPMIYRKFASRKLGIRGAETHQSDKLNGNTALDRPTDETI